jgi:hypothetical protein
MQEYTVVVQEALGAGLRSSAHSGRNTQWLFAALGAMPEDKVLQAVPELPSPLAIASEVFPFPQIFNLRRMTLVCGKKDIYEYKSGVLSILLTGSASGWTWSVADFGEFIAMTNGKILVTRDPQTGQFGEYGDCKIPPCLCICEFNGQVVVGGPGESVADGFTGA